MAKTFTNEQTAELYDHLIRYQAHLRATAVRARQRMAADYADGFTEQAEFDREQLTDAEAASRSVQSLLDLIAHT